MHLGTAREVSNGTLLFAQCDPGFRTGRKPIGRRPQHDEALIDVFTGGLDILLILLEIELKLLQFLTPARGIVLQS
jgi:hypothetical protein